MAVVGTDEYKKMDEEFGDCLEKCFGPTLLGFPEGNDSSRLYMFSSHEKQFLNILNPDVAHVQSGYENPFGEHSKAYKKMKGAWEVKKIIKKYDTGSIYTIFLYNATEHKWDAVEKQIAENLTEKFGYIYNTSKMDSLKVGDTITDDVLYKTTSYDEHMNYRAGKNARVMYVTDNSTIEDAIRIRKGWAETVKTVEVDEVVVNINNNDILLNMYGDDKTYKAFPDIGESLRDSTVCATRRFNKSHMLYDFQQNRLSTITDIDDEYVSSKGSIIYDIDIFYNGDDAFPDNIFYSQLKKYYDMESEYAKEINEMCTFIENSGDSYSPQIPYINAKYQVYNWKDYQWKGKDKAFANLMVIFRTCAKIDLQEGFKLTGRYGDKGVISHIANDGTSSTDKLSQSNIDEYNDIAVNIANQLDPAADIREAMKKNARDVVVLDDCDMPYYFTEDGEKVIVDIQLNSSGAIRRLNTDQLAEVEINFCGEQLQRYIKKLPTTQEKIDIVFRFLELLNRDEHDFFLAKWNYLHQLEKVDGYTVRIDNVAAQNAFIKDIEDNGFYIIKRPDAVIRYDVISAIYDEWQWIKPYDAYIDLFGIKGKKIMRPVIIGSKYMLLLKQTANKNFSARSTGRTDKRQCPAKSNDKKNNRSPYSRSPIKIGEFHALASAISGMTMAEFNIPTRSSPIARKDLKTILGADGNPCDVADIKIKDNYLNVNAQILNSYLKCLGIELVFDIEDHCEDIYEDVITDFRSHNFTIIDIPSRKPIYDFLFTKYEEYLDTVAVVSFDEEDKVYSAWDWVFDQDDVKKKDLDGITKETMLNYTLSARQPIIDDTIKSNNSKDNDDQDDIDSVEEADNIDDSE